MGKLNLAVNQLLERKEIFADFINGTLFDGEQVLREEELQRLSGHSGVFQREKERLSVTEREGDIRMEAAIGSYSVIFSNETQGEVHYAMPVRNMLYDALEYMKQVQEIEKRYAVSGEKLKGKELLSGMKKQDCIKPVITTVLYVGDEWDGYKSLKEMLNMDEENMKKIEKYLPDYQIHVINAGKISKTEKFRTCLRHIFTMMKYRKDKELLYRYINDNKEAIERMDYIETMATFILLGEQKRVEEILAVSDKEDISMCKAIDDLIKDGEERGEKRGEERVFSLVNCLYLDGKMHLIPEIEKNKKLKEKLYLQYQI